MFYYGQRSKCADLLNSYSITNIKESPLSLIHISNMDIVPRTFIFGAKAAAGYKRAKLTIKLINNVANVINNDK